MVMRNINSWWEAALDTGRPAWHSVMTERGGMGVEGEGGSKGQGYKYI